MLEYFIFVMMIIGGAAIIVTALDKKKGIMNDNPYASISGRGKVRSQGKKGISYKRPGYHSIRKNESKNDGKSKFDTLFKSDKRQDMRERQKRMAERRKSIRPGEVEIPVSAWGADGKKMKDNIKKKNYDPYKLLKHTETKEPTGAQVSKLSKVKKRVMDIYDDTYSHQNAEPQENHDEKKSIFSMFGSSEPKQEVPQQPVNRPQQEPAFQPPSQATPQPRQNDFPNPFVNAPKEETRPAFQPPQDNGFQKPKNDDSISTEDVFNRMLAGGNKDEKPKKKDNTEWTPMF